MVTSFYCYIVFSIVALLSHVSHYSVEVDTKQIRGSLTFTVSRHTADYYIEKLNVSLIISLPLPDGGVWQSSLQKAPFPSGSVDQLPQETLCQARWSLAQRYLCQVSLKLKLFYLLFCSYVTRIQLMMPVIV